MSEISVKKLPVLLPAVMDDEGRPVCFCGCAQPMVETAPGQWSCVLQRAALDRVAAAMPRLLDNILGESP